MPQILGIHYSKAQIIKYNFNYKIFDNKFDSDIRELLEPLFVNIENQQKKPRLLINNPEKAHFNRTIKLTIQIFARILYLLLAYILFITIWIIIPFIL